VFEEYPSLDNGLSQTEENVPWNTGEGSSILGIAAKTLGNSDGTIGDIPLYDRIRNFLSDAEPLLEPAVPGVSVADVDSREAFLQLAVGPTTLGKQLLSRDANYVQINGVDRWIGGVHLCGKSVYVALRSAFQTFGQHTTVKERAAEPGQIITNSLRVMAPSSFEFSLVAANYEDFALSAGKRGR
jgi:hypothetical protein